MLILGLIDVPWWAMLIGVIALYLLYECRNFNYFKNQGIAGPRAYPILGTFGANLGTPLTTIDMKFLDLYGDMKCFGEFLGSRPSLSVLDEDMLSDIMVKEFSAFTNRMSFKSGSPINDNMLTNLDDAHWKHVRNEMTPTFTTGKLKKMNVEINRCGKTLANSLDEEAKGSGIVEMKEYAGGFTMDVISSTAFGIRVDSQKDRNNAFVDHARRAFTFSLTSPVLLLLVFFPGLANFLSKLGLSIDIFPKDIREFFSNITLQAIEMRKEDSDQSRSDFLQLMLKAQAGENIHEDEDGKKSGDKSTGTGITTDEIVANAMLFFVAGYDTTATSLSFFMYNMARFPETQEKLMKEIKKVIGDKETIDTTDVQDMPYLDQCVHENLRLYPPAIRSNRVANRDITIRGVYIAKDVLVNIPIFAIHMDPKKWPEPDKFDPERFSPENKKDRSPYHFLPFGNGPRNCIGMRLALQELKVAIIHALRKVKITTCEKTQIPIRFANNGGLIKSEGGIHLKVEPRDRE